MKALILAPPVSGTAITIDGELAAQKALLIGNARQISTVDDGLSQEIAVGVVQELKRLLSTVETSRVEIKAPVLDIGRKIDAAAKQFGQDIEAEVSRLTRSITTFQAAERRRAEEAERKRLEELRRIELARQAAERIAREQAEAARIAAEAKARAEAEALFGDEETGKAEQEAAAQREREAQRLAEENRQRQETLVRQFATARSMVSAAPATASGLTVKPVWTFEVTNLRALVVDRPQLCRIEPNRQEINKAIAAGMRECPGLRIYQDLKAGVRV